MSETAPLLGRISAAGETSIFLRPCHSPWLFISQRSLLFIRTLIAAFLLALLGLDLYFEIAIAGRGQLFVFLVGNVGLMIQLIYYLLTAYWTFLHSREPTSTTVRNATLAKVNSFFGIPGETSWFPNRFLFSVFYTAAVTLPLAISIIFWFIIVPTTPTTDLALPDLELCSAAGGAVWLKPFCDGWIKAIVLGNLNITNFIIALTEVLFLSSIRRQRPIWAHILGLVVICALYIGWLFLGKLLTGVYVYKWIDPAYDGIEAFLIAIVSMISLVVCMFVVQFGLHGIREMLAARRHQGYSQI